MGRMIKTPNPYGCKVIAYFFVWGRIFLIKVLLLYTFYFTYITFITFIRPQEKSKDKY